MTLDIALDRPWLTARFPGPRRVLSWAVHRSGFQIVSAVTWREVRNADLTPDFDIDAWVPEEFAAHGVAQHVGLLTSRDVRRFRLADATVAGVRADCLATVGLSNAEAVGRRLPVQAHRDWGTINILVHVGLPLSDTALIELISIAAEARTAAVLSSGHMLPTGAATGTGTDCIVVAALPGTAPYAGLHTAQGEAAGRAVFDAVARGAADWVRDTQQRGNAAS